MGPSMVIPTAPCGQPRARKPPGWRRCCLLGLGASGLPMVGEVASSFFAKRVCAGVVLEASRLWRGGIAPATGLGGGTESTKISPQL